MGEKPDLLDEIEAALRAPAGPAPAEKPVAAAFRETVPAPADEALLARLMEAAPQPQAERPATWRPPTVPRR